MSKEFPLVTEGEWSEDGRYVTMGSTTWHEPPIPLRWVSDDPHDLSPVVGMVTRVWRDGDTIKCEAEIRGLWDEETRTYKPLDVKSITVDTDSASIEATDDFSLKIDGPRIIGGIVWEDDRYIWKHDA